MKTLKTKAAEIKTNYSDSSELIPYLATKISAVPFVITHTPLPHDFMNPVVEIYYADGREQTIPVADWNKTLAKTIVRIPKSDKKLHAIKFKNPKKSVKQIVHVTTASKKREKEITTKLAIKRYSSWSQIAKDLKIGEQVVIAVCDRSESFTRKGGFFQLLAGYSYVEKTKDGYSYSRRLMHEY
jgi:hypothetical protein